MKFNSWGYTCGQSSIDERLAIDTVTSFLSLFFSLITRLIPGKHLLGVRGCRLSHTQATVRAIAHMRIIMWRAITVKVYVCYRTYMNANISLTKAYEPPHCPDMRRGRYHAESRSALHFHPGSDTDYYSLLLAVTVLQKSGRKKSREPRLPLFDEAHRTE